MTDLVLAIYGHDNDNVTSYHAVESFPVNIGRAYSNDIILSDPYVAALQACISVRDDGAWQIEDLGGGNAVRVNGSLFAWPARCVSGDTLQIGSTHIRLFRPDHPVPPPIILDGSGDGFLALTKPSSAWGLYVVMLLAAMLWSYMADWSEKPEMVMASVAAVISILVFIWSGLWSVAGRMAHKTASFVGHVAIMSLYIIALFVVWLINNSIGFILNENLFSQMFAYLIDTALLMGVIYGALTLATRMAQRRRMIASACGSFGLALGLLVIGLVASRNFTSKLPVSLLLKPYLAPVVSVTSVDEFMQGNAELFQSNKIKISK